MALESSTTGPRRLGMPPRSDIFLIQCRADGLIVITRSTVRYGERIVFICTWYRVTTRQWFSIFDDKCNPSWSNTSIWSHGSWGLQENIIPTVVHMVFFFSYVNFNNFHTHSLYDREIYNNANHENRWSTQYTFVCVALQTFILQQNSLATARRTCLNYNITGLLSWYTDLETFKRVRVRSVYCTCERIQIPGGHPFEITRYLRFASVCYYLILKNILNRGWHVQVRLKRMKSLEF